MYIKGQRSVEQHSEEVLTGIQVGHQPYQPNGCPYNATLLSSTKAVIRKSVQGLHAYDIRMYADG